MMGKKSRRKRGRHKLTAIDAAIKAALHRRGTPSEDREFKRVTGDLEAFFSRFNAEDVYVSLCVSDLWLPNVSSQVKHALAFGIAASMPPDRFVEGNTIETYPEFQAFTTQLYAMLPSFPWLEDYVPEADWGEVKANSMGSLLHIFYGTSIERTPDFITAFQFLHEQDASALKDMHAALYTQNHIISNVDRIGAGGAGQDLEPGHIEIPAEAFWARCREAVISASLLSETSGVSAGLVLRPGQFTPPHNWMNFGDAIMTGSALPAFLLEVGCRRYPMALRNSAGAVIRYWSDKRPNDEAVVKAASNAIGAFLEERFDPDSLITGPFHLVSPKQRLPYTFAAAMMGGPKVHLIIALAYSSLARLSDIERDVRTFLNMQVNWAMQRPGETGVHQIRGKNGTLPTNGELDLIAVLAGVETTTRAVKVPKTKVRVLPLADFVTIYDSVEELEELDGFWTFVDRHALSISAFSSVVDRFAAYRDSHKLLAAGAITPSFIGLDPHWGSTWRFQQLTEFWRNAPPLFPDDRTAAWKVKREHDHLYRLVCKCAPVLSWCTVINDCVVHFLFDLTGQPLEADDGHTLELVVHSLADSLDQRRAIISGLPLFNRRRVVTVCLADPALLATGADDAPTDENPLFSGWGLASKAGDETTRATVKVNLRRVRQRVTTPVDASYEAEAVNAWIDGISRRLGIPNDPVVLGAITTSGSRRPRFTLTVLPRLVDIPDLARPVLPGLEHYKIARRDLAVIFKEVGANPGRYELETAKTLIDTARDMFRRLVHERIAELNRIQLVVFSVEQLDALIGRFDSAAKTAEISLSHDVSYSRTEKLADAHRTFVRESRNYRYLLETCLSISASETTEVTSERVVEIVASIDWLHVLYDASDTLHNGLDVAGLELDHFFVPEIRYSEGREEREKVFAAEMADLRLGIGVTPTDRVDVVREDSDEWKMVDAAFLHDTGVRFADFAAGLLVLSRWSSTSKDSDLGWSYTAPRARVRDVLVESIKDLTATDADRIISLATIDPRGIRRLLGKPNDETDVPIWEHNKRGNRYTIKPLIPLDADLFLWGAASAERAARIWTGSVADGFLPADFDWPNVVDAVRSIKSRLDQQLEMTAFQVVNRATPFAARGMDFKRRFPREGLEDVGDYDVLAYWPSTNQWLIAECKYNQPAFCLKDARRLRDRIFGTGNNRAQFSKIERRRDFLSANQNRLRSLLEWPPPNGATPASITEVYVSREIYWWMRNPPYETPTHFVRIDVLDHWVRKSGFLESHDAPVNPDCG